MESRDHAFSFGQHGSHRAWTEGNDVVHIAWHGDVSSDDVTTGAKAFDLVPNRDKGFFLIVHVREQGQFSPEARKAMSSDPRSRWVREVVVSGAGFHVRVLLGMVSKAMYALGVNKAKLSFVEHERDVPAQIARMRNNWAEKHGGSL